MLRHKAYSAPVKGAFGYTTFRLKQNMNEEIFQSRRTKNVQFDLIFFNNTIYQIEIQPPYYWMATVSKAILKQILHLQKYNNCLNTSEFHAMGQLIFFWQK